jgi:hypothetical protein
MREFEVNRYGLFLAGCFSFKGNISLGSDSGAWVNVVDRCRTWHSITVAIKRRINASQHFRSFWGAWRTIAGYEAIHMIRKGQAYGSAAGAKAGLLHRFIVSMFGIEA